MRIITLAAALALSACTVVPNSPHDGVRSLADGSLMVKEIDRPFVSVAERAASYCGYFGQRVEVVSITATYGVITEREHPVLVFRCVSSTT